jgi:hypothetical protein
MPKGKGERMEVTTLTDLLSDVFRIGYKAGAEEAFKDEDEALEDEEIDEAITKLHERYGNQLVRNLESFLDLAEDVDDAEEEEDEVDDKSK